MSADNLEAAVEPGTWRGSVVDYIAHYGGRCRDCGDADGVCPTDGKPCDSTVCRAAYSHAVRAINYGVKHGYLALSSSNARAVAAEEALRDVREALDCALLILEPLEPGDSRAVSNEFVAMMAAGTPHHNDEGREIIRAFIARTTLASMKGA